MAQNKEGRKGGEDEGGKERGKGEWKTMREEKKYSSKLLNKISCSIPQARIGGGEPVLAIGVVSWFVKPGLSLPPNQSKVESMGRGQSRQSKSKISEVMC